METSHASYIWDKLVSSPESLTEPEARALKELFDSEEGRAFINGKLRETWDGKPVPEKDADFDSFYRSIKDRIGARRRLPFLSPRLRNIAAMLFIPLLVASVYLIAKPSKEKLVALNLVPVEQEYSVPAGMKSKLVLPDGSLVWLNSGSRLIVEGNYGDSLRRVAISGEGYFNVRSISDIPFIVGARDMEIEVTGTEFNISAYESSDTLEAVLVSGEILARTEGYDGLEDVLRMSPAQRLRLNGSDKTAILESQVDIEAHTAWKDNLMIFKSTPIRSVAITLERWFNVQVNVLDQRLYDLEFTGKFDNRSLEQVLRFLKISSSLDYEIIEDVVNLRYR